MIVDDLRKMARIATPEEKKQEMEEYIKIHPPVKNLAGDLTPRIPPFCHICEHIFSDTMHVCPQKYQ